MTNDLSAENFKGFSSSILKNIAVRQKAENEANKTYNVRLYDDGGIIYHTNFTREPSVWTPNISFRNPREGSNMSSEATAFTITGWKPEGTPLKFGNDCYVVTEARSKETAKKFEADSLFVRPITENAYKELTSKTNS